MLYRCVRSCFRKSFLPVIIGCACSITSYALIYKAVSSYNADAVILPIVLIFSTLCSAYVFARDVLEGFLSIILFVLINGILQSLSAALMLYFFRGTLGNTIFGAGVYGITLFITSSSFLCCNQSLALFTAIALNSKLSRGIVIKIIVFILILLGYQLMEVFFHNLSKLQIVATVSGISFDSAFTATSQGSYSWLPIASIIEFTVGIVCVTALCGRR